MGKKKLGKKTHSRRRQPKKNYKDGVFRMLFNNEEKIRELYQALTGEDSTGQEVKIVTLDDAIYVDMKNDLAFAIGLRYIVLAEHQSTVNPNMALRMLLYVSKEYERYYTNNSIYGNKIMNIPKPMFYVFYNGTAKCPPEQTIKLSDAFPEKCDKITLEVEVKVINVNHNEGAEILKKCKTLQEYSLFIQTIRDRLESGASLETTIDEVIKEFIKKGILVDFLKENGGEVVSILTQELSAEEYREILAKDAREDGHAEGHAEGLAEGLAEGHAEGLAEGLAEGHAEGLAEGLAEGHAEGLAEGRKSEQVRMVIGMKNEGIPTEAIAKISGLSVEKIEEIVEM